MTAPKDLRKKILFTFDSRYKSEGMVPENVLFAVSKIQPPKQTTVSIAQRETGQTNGETCTVSGQDR
jgi:hypothetical protein